jgi:hypothetical protein
MKYIILLLALLVMMYGCAETESDDDDEPNHVFNYTLYSNSGNLPIGRRVVYIHIKCTDSSCNTADGNPIPTYNAKSVEAGQVPISFTHHYVGWYYVTIYIDVDDSNTLTQGDLVWGRDPNDIYALKSNYSDSDTENNTNYTWELVAQSEFGGYSTYTGTPQNWSIKPKSQNTEVSGSIF